MLPHAYPLSHYSRILQALSAESTVKTAAYMGALLGGFGVSYTIIITWYR